MDGVGMAMLSSTTLYDDQCLFRRFDVDGGREFTHVSSVAKAAKYSVSAWWTRMLLPFDGRSSENEKEKSQEIKAGYSLKRVYLQARVISLHGGQGLLSS